MKEKPIIKKPFFYGALAYIATFVVAIFNSILSMIFSFFSTDKIFNLIYSIIYQLIMVALAFFAFYSFYYLGKKYNVNLLKTIVVISFVFTCIISLCSIGMSFYSMGGGFDNFISKMNQSAVRMDELSKQPGYENSTEYQQALNGMVEQIMPLFLIAMVVIIIGIIILSVLVILFGVSLLKLDKQVNLAKVTGILNIVAGATMIIFIGFIILFVATIFEIIILFQEAKKAKEYQ